MSPGNAMERSYGTLKQMLRDGVFVPGARLEANRLANELGVSMTPIRDALSRLAGEQMVDATIGEGFHVPRFTEAALRDLYEWSSVLLSLASRTIDIEAVLAIKGDAGASIADRTSALFDEIADRAPNREIRSALLIAGDRLHPFRILEGDVFEDLEEEIVNFRSSSTSVNSAIRRYHLRRMREVPQILKRRNHQRLPS